MVAEMGVSAGFGIQLHKKDWVVVATGMHGLHEPTCILCIAVT